MSAGRKGPGQPRRDEGAGRTAAELGGGLRGIGQRSNVRLCRVRQPQATASRMSHPVHLETNDLAAFRTRGSSSDRFFAIPFDAIAGFEEVAEAARSLATLPTNLDLDHFARANDELDERRRQLLIAPDVARLSLQEGVELVRQRSRLARGDPKPTRLNEWRLRATNCEFQFPSPRIRPLRRALDRFFGCECRCVGDQLYPPGAFKGWHTDRFIYAGWLLFLVQVARPGRSSFRYLDAAEGDMVVVPERNDVAYFFRTSAEKPLFWHGVLCEDTYRWSQGFIVPSDWQSRLRLRKPAGG